MIEKTANVLGDVGVPPINPVPDPVPIIEGTSNVGKRGLWVVAVLMLLSSLIFYILAARVAVSKRLFHILVSLVTTISFLSYFAMAMGLGVTYNHASSHEHHKHGPDTTQDIYREVYWARYLNWGLTMPLIIICLTLLSGLNGASLLVSVSANLIMVVTGLISACIAHHGRTWAWYTISCLAYLTIVYQVGFRGRRATQVKDQKIRTFYSSLAGFSLLTMLVYPIIWAAASNSRRMTVDAEIIVYAILDVLLQGVFGYWLLVSYDNWQSSTLNLDGFWSNGFGSEGGIRIGEREEA